MFNVYFQIILLLAIPKAFLITTGNIITSYDFVSRGWGLRCLDDIPSGGFICVYAGQLLTEQGANEVNKTHT